MSEKVYVKNASDEKQVKDAEYKVKSGRERDLEDVMYILSSKQGRRFIWRYLTECGIFQTSFTGNSTTFFKEGERNVGLKLMTDINESSPDAYVLMMKESKEN